MENLKNNEQFIESNEKIVTKKKNDGTFEKTIIKTTNNGAVETYQKTTTKTNKDGSTEKIIETRNSRVATESGDIIVNEEAFENEDKKSLKRTGLGIAFAGAILVAFLAGRKCNVSSEDVTSVSCAPAFSDIVSNEEEKEDVEEEKYDVNVFDDINDVDKVEARADLFIAELNKIVEASGKDINVSDYDQDRVIRMINFFNDGYVEGTMRDDHSEYANYICGLTNLSNELDVNIPMHLLLTDGSLGQELAKQLNEVHNDMITSLKSDNQENAEEAVRELDTIIYGAYVIHGWNGAIDVTRLDCSGQKFFNLMYGWSLDQFAQEIICLDDDKNITFLDSCEQELSHDELFEAIAMGTELPHHHDALLVDSPIVGFEVPYIPAYGLEAEDEMMAKADTYTLTK